MFKERFAREKCQKLHVKNCIISVPSYGYQALWKDNINPTLGSGSDVKFPSSWEDTSGSPVPPPLGVYIGKCITTNLWDHWRNEASITCRKTSHFPYT